MIKGVYYEVKKVLHNKVFWGLVFAFLCINCYRISQLGAYDATVSEGVVREAFNGIWGMGRPKRKAKEWGKKYWDSEEAFTEEDPSNLGSPDIALGDVPTSPYGGTKGYGGGTYSGALDIGCSYGVGSR